MRLFLLALARFTAGVALTGGLLFWSAGGFDYWNAWLLIGRIRQEEKLLSCQLPGYADYMQRVRWRLLPGVW